MSTLLSSIPISEQAAPPEELELLELELELELELLELELLELEEELLELLLPGSVLPPQPTNNCATSMLVVNNVLSLICWPAVFQIH